MKDGKLLAYTLLSQQTRDSVIFEHMASAAEARNLGVILLPYVYSADRFFELGYRDWTFAVYPSNVESNRIRMTLDREVHFDERVTRRYVWRRR